MNKGYKIEKLIPKKENREDSFWYRDESIAKITFPNGKALYADCCGEIRVQFEVDGEVYRNHKAVERAKELGLTDKDLTRWRASRRGWPGAARRCQRSS